MIATVVEMLILGSANKILYDGPPTLPSSGSRLIRGKHGSFVKLFGAAVSLVEGSLSPQ